MVLEPTILRAEATFKAQNVFLHRQEDMNWKLVGVQFGKATRIWPTSINEIGFKNEQVQRLSRCTRGSAHRF